MHNTTAATSTAVVAKHPTSATTGDTKLAKHQRSHYKEHHNSNTHSTGPTNCPTTATEGITATTDNAKAKANSKQGTHANAAIR